MKLKWRFWIYAALLFLVNIPTFVVLLRPFYEWGSWFVHEPVNSRERVLSALFDFAEKIALTIGFPFLYSLTLCILIWINIARTKDIESKKSIAVVKSLIVGLAIIITRLSLDTMMFFPWYWI